MEKYQQPELEIVKFDLYDIISTSGEAPDPDDTEEDLVPMPPVSD
jgi:hypothetical protein